MPAILEVSSLRKLYPISRGLFGALRSAPQEAVHAIDGVSFTMQKGEILGLAKHWEQRNSVQHACALLCQQERIPS